MAARFSPRRRLTDMNITCASSRLKLTVTAIAASVALAALPFSATAVSAADHRDAGDRPEVSQRHRAGTPGASCTDSVNEVLPLRFANGATGIYSLPPKAPSALVVMAHGYGNNSSAWQQHVLDARTHNAVAVAMNYRGLGPAPGYLGWPAKAGSEDLVAAAQFLVGQCRSISRVVLVGISMGGNMSGLALAAGARRANNRPLFDYWVDIEGATNWNETWAGATALTPVSGYAKQAAKDIEHECGDKSPAANPTCYQERTVTARIADIAKSGVRGIAVVHAVEDGLVPSDQSREFVTAARASGLRTDMYNVLRRDPNDYGQTGQTTIISQGDPNADCTGGGSGAVSGFGSGVCDPMAGHGWEGSSTQVVIRTGLDLTWAFLKRNPANPRNRECVVDAVSVPTPLCVG
ncbi:MAG: alpha/beta hydrolase family protein [Candidatus Dormibacteria bacterium]